MQQQPSTSSSSYGGRLRSGRYSSSSKKCVQNDGTRPCHQAHCIGRSGGQAPPLSGAATFALAVLCRRRHVCRGWYKKAI
ncbi:hypothetical protein NL676_007559 [Syzygium grande]|nr:hypothetical protein NL676_007559 [Syzygium grande]